VLTALVVGALCSGSGAFLDYAAKQRDAATLKSLRLAAEATRLTTADATLYLSITIDKSLPALAPLMSKLESALKYAKQNCRSPGSVANCKDYIIRSVIIDEIRFKNKSQLFPALSSDPQANGILTSLGVIVRFYNKKLKPTLKLDEDEVGALIIDQETIGHETLYEYDGVVLRLFIAGGLPEDAFKTAGVLSIVDLLGKSITVRPIAEGQKICPQKSIEHDCDEHLLALLHAVTVEDVAIHFPHRHNIEFGRWQEGKDQLGTRPDPEHHKSLPFQFAEDNLNVRYMFVNFPDEIEDWPIGEETR
jgi:hypothetical protein